MSHRTLKILVVVQFVVIVVLAVALNVVWLQNVDERALIRLWIPRTSSSTSP